MKTLADLATCPRRAPSTAQVWIRQLVAAKTSSGGIRVDIHLTEDMPLITSRAQRDRGLEEDSKKELGRVVESLRALRRGSVEGPLRFRLDGCGFRHASAGVLPRAPDGACWLFARDIAPVGWNIANGGSQSLTDLLRPVGLMAREAAEEMLFFHPARRILGTLAPLGAYAELDRAVELWRERLDLSGGPVAPLAHDFGEGPDTLVVRHDDDVHVTRGVHLSLQAEDASLEVIRVLQLDSEIAGEWTPLDGEILHDRLLDRAVGCFRPESWTPRAVHQGGRPVDAPPRLPPCPVTRHIRRALGAPDVPDDLFNPRPR